MDPRDKKKSIFDQDAIIQLKHNGQTKRVFYNQISSANLSLAFNLRSSEGLFLRRPDVRIIFKIIS